MIPRTIHRIWLGGPEPDWLAAFAPTWEQPGWTVRQWGEDEVGDLFPIRANQDIYDHAAEIAPRNVGQLRSDLLRLEILHRHGGVYVDADFECIRPIDPLLEDVDCFAAWEEQGKWVNNAIVGATPGHRFITALIDSLDANVRHFRGKRPNFLTGPRYVTRMWRLLGQQDVEVFDRDLFYPYGWQDADRHDPGEARAEFPDAYAVHHWFNKRGRPTCLS